ncbi:MAG TPA: hypothetical protein VFN87_09440 [Solirubrobacteraceae bacterium]|nr:hypothetical protein [Solirubrobacteraceae bacterium]
MTEHPERPDSEEEVQRERRESTDLGYRDTEEERAYEQAAEEEGDGAAGGDESAADGG